MTLLGLAEGRTIMPQQLAPDLKSLAHRGVVLFAGALVFSDESFPDIENEESPSFWEWSSSRFHVEDHVDVDVPSVEDSEYPGVEIPHIEEEDQAELVRQAIGFSVELSKSFTALQTPMTVRFFIEANTTLVTCAFHRVRGTPDEADPVLECNKGKDYPGQIRMIVLDIEAESNRAVEKRIRTEQNVADS